MKKAAIIMAAGLGTRMKSKKSKVLHEVCGTPMLQWVVDALSSLKLDRIVVVLGVRPGPEFDCIRGRVSWVVQKEKKGTGHAVMQAEKVLEKFDGNVLILSGDVPLIRAETLRNLLRTHERESATATILTALMENPRGYGRILKRDGFVERIVEEPDADAEIRRIREVNTGTYCFRNRDLREALKKVRLNPLKKEYYLTDVFGILNGRGARIIPLVAEDPGETMGVNTRVELVQADGIMQNRIQRRFLEEGVTIVDCGSTRIDSGARIGPDTVILPYSVICGRTRIGADCRIGPGARLTDAVLKDGVRIRDSWVEAAVVPAGTDVGPYLHIRKGNFSRRSGSHKTDESGRQR